LSHHCAEESLCFSPGEDQLTFMIFSMLLYLTGGDCVVVVELKSLYLQYFLVLSNEISSH